MDATPPTELSQPALKLSRFVVQGCLDLSAKSLTRLNLDACRPSTIVCCPVDYDFFPDRGVIWSSRAGCRGLSKRLPQSNRDVTEA